MNKRNKLIVFVTLMMLLLVSVPSVFAYFSTYTMTKGSKKITIEGSSYLEETVESWTKKIVIEAAAESSPIFVRARAFAPEYIQSKLSYEGEGWEKYGDYYYYASPIDGKDDTTQYLKETKTLNIIIPEDNLPRDSKEGDQFHIVVVYESTPYLGDGVNNADYWKNAEIVDGGES